MECVICGGKTKVAEVRKKDGKYYRRRACLDPECGERFTTYEVNQIHLLNVLDQYLPEKLVDELSHILLFNGQQE
ncbi:hypothetical protein D7X33_35070 [Butyricicoccus sp. 1XD8-22]|nr:hypothetical protein D7X33_35070 [Butyricicoccus sp. 1XD8-22]